MSRFTLYYSFALTILMVSRMCIEASPYYFIKHDKSQNTDLQNVLRDSCLAWTCNSQNEILTCSDKGCVLASRNVTVPAGLRHVRDVRVMFVTHVNYCGRSSSTEKCLPVMNVTLTMTYADSTNSGVINKNFLTPNWTIESSNRFNTSQTVSSEFTIQNRRHKNSRLASIRISIEPYTFCGRILGVYVFTDACPKTVTNLVKYPFSVTEGRVNATCIDNAFPVVNGLYGVCQPNVGYLTFKGICACARGHTLSENSFSCQACEAGYFKIDVGNHACLKCGQNSIRSSQNIMQNCQCMLGFVRRFEDKDNSSKPCYDKRVFGKCRAERVVVSLDEVYTFQSRNCGEKYPFSCIYGLTVEAKVLRKPPTLFRACVLSENNEAIWEPLNVSRCRHHSQGSSQLDNVDFDNLDNETVEAYAEVVSNLTSNSSSINNLKALVGLTNILEKIISIQNTTVKVKQKVLGILENTLSVNASLVGNLNINGTNKFLGFIDDIADSIETPEFHYSGQHLGLTIENVDNTFQTELAATLFGSSRVGITVNENKSDADNETTLANVQIPSGAYPGDHNRPNSTFKIISKVFRKSTFFASSSSSLSSSSAATNKQEPKNNKLDVVGSVVMSASVKDYVIENLTDPVKLDFKVGRSFGDGRSKGRCVYWETDGNYWSTRGCSTSRQEIEEEIFTYTCRCTHLTNFAILFNVFQEDEGELRSQEVLNYVSLIGCILSTGCLAATLVALVCAKKMRQKTAQRIIINFCLALLLLLSTFMLITNISITSPMVCHSVSALLHFLILSTFTWTAVQAFFLYKKAVRATKNRGSNRKSFYCCFILAWGIPAATAALTSRLTQSQFVEPIDKVCIISGDIFTYSVTIPIASIIGLNFLVFIPVIRKIQSHITTRATFQADENQLRRRVKVTIACVILLGLTWVFAFMAIGDLRAPLQWLFCITNSLQGVFIFVFYVALNGEVRKAWSSSWSSTTSSFASTFVIRAATKRRATEKERRITKLSSL